MHLPRELWIARGCATRSYLLPLQVNFCVSRLTSHRLRSSRSCRPLTVVQCASLLFVGACQTPARSSIYFGPACSNEAYPPDSLLLVRARLPDSALVATDAAAITVRVRDAKSDAPLPAARVQLHVGADSARADADAAGVVHELRLRHDGRVALSVHRFGYTPLLDSVHVRRGFRDSLVLGLGKRPLCMYAAKPTYLATASN